MKKHLFILTITILILLLTLTTVSCKKEALPPQETKDESQETKDESTINIEEETDIDKEEDNDNKAKDNIDKIKATIPEAVAKSKIVFVSMPHQSGWNDIYIMNGDGSNQTNITNTTDDAEFNPCFSPDGTKIAFVSSLESCTQIYIMNVDDSGKTKLTDLGSNMSPCFSPDGTKVAFISWRDEGPEVYTMNIDGSEQTRLTNGGGGEPCFSPDGTKIAFTSERSGNSEIYIMNIDGSEQTRLTNNAEAGETGEGENELPAYSPCFSPDGTKIAYSSYTFGLFNFEIYIMNVDGSEQVNITNNPAYDGSPCFSPDGTKIAFQTGRDKIPEPGAVEGNYLSNDEIYLMNTDGSEQVNITNNPDGDDREPCFSP